MEVENHPPGGFLYSGSPRFPIYHSQLKYWGKHIILPGNLSKGRLPLVWWLGLVVKERFPIYPKKNLLLSPSGKTYPNQLPWIGQNESELFGYQVPGNREVSLPIYVHQADPSKKQSEQETRIGETRF